MGGGGAQSPLIGRAVWDSQVSEMEKGAGTSQTKLKTASINTTSVNDVTLRQ